MKPNHAERTRYRTWRLRLKDIMAAYERLQRHIGKPGEYLARRTFHDTARSLDALNPPARFGSWEDLGDAIHGRGYRRKTW